MDDDRFEALLRATPDGDWKQAVVDVADTALLCVAWFGARSLTPTADAIIRMVELVMRRRSELERGAFEGDGA